MVRCLLDSCTGCCARGRSLQSHAWLLHVQDPADVLHLAPMGYRKHHQGYAWTRKSGPRNTGSLSSPRGRRAHRDADIPPGPGGPLLRTTAGAGEELLLPAGLMDHDCSCMSPMLSAWQQHGLQPTDPDLPGHAWASTIMGHQRSAMMVQARQSIEIVHWGWSTFSRLDLCILPLERWPSRYCLPSSWSAPSSSGEGTSKCALRLMLAPCSAQQAVSHAGNAWDPRHLPKLQYAGSCCQFPVPIQRLTWSRLCRICASA